MSGRSGCLGFLFKAKNGAASKGLPCRLRDSFLTGAELSFYRVLLVAVGDTYAICPKVNMHDLFLVLPPGEKRDLHAWIGRGHIDFLLCDKMTMQPVLGLEIDDRFDEHNGRSEWDLFVDDLFLAAKLPLGRVYAAAAYDPADVRRYVFEAAGADQRWAEEEPGNWRGPVTVIEETTVSGPAESPSVSSLEEEAVRGGSGEELAEGPAVSFPAEAAGGGVGKPAENGPVSTMPAMAAWDGRGEGSAENQPVFDPVEAARGGAGQPEEKGSVSTWPEMAALGWSGDEPAKSPDLSFLQEEGFRPGLDKEPAEPAESRHLSSWTEEAVRPGREAEAEAGLDLPSRDEEAPTAGQPAYFPGGREEQAPPLPTPEGDPAAEAAATLSPTSLRGIDFTFPPCEPVGETAAGAASAISPEGVPVADKYPELEIRRVREKLMEEIVAEVSSAAAPFCPLCNVPMVLRTSRRGIQFYSCANFSRCRQVRGLLE